jgi:hypothetical protein
MKRWSFAVLVALAGLTLSVAGCGGSTPSEEGAPAAEGGMAPGGPIGSLEPDPSRPRLIAAVRGVAEVGYLAPVTRRQSGEVVTTFRIKNLATGPIAGFRVDEYWYDSAGETVSGGQYRHPKPFLEGEVIEVVLQTPTNPRMARSRWEMAHQNGEIKATQLKTLDEIPAAAPPTE